MSGATYFFERAGDDDAFPPLIAGEIVTFTQPGEAQLARLATDVRALASGRRETRPIAAEPEQGGRVRAARFARAGRIAATAESGS